MWETLVTTPDGQIRTMVHSTRHAAVWHAERYTPGTATVRLYPGQIHRLCEFKGQSANKPEKVAQ